MKELIITLKAEKDKWDIEEVRFKVKSFYKINKWLKKLFDIKYI